MLATLQMLLVEFSPRFMYNSDKEFDLSDTAFLQN